MSRCHFPRFYGSQLRIPSCTFVSKRWTTTPTTKHEKPSSIKRWREIFQECNQKNNLTLTDWYHVDAKSVLDNSAKYILKEHFNNSLYEALSTIFPESKWYPWKFQHHNVPSGFWQEQSNHKQFFEVLAQEVGVQNMDDWYTKLSNKLMVSHGGSTLLRQHNNSCFEALKAAYPEHEWVPWKFLSVNRGFWKSVENQRKFFDWLGKKIGVHTFDDWYSKVSAKVVLENGGSFLIHYYKGSPAEAIKAAYPEHPWKSEKFANSSLGFWKSLDKQKEFFDDLAKKIGITSLDGWYTKASIKTVLEHGGTFLTLYDGSVMNALMTVYPEHNWIPWKFQNVPRGFWKDKKNQRDYFEYVGKLAGVKELDDWYKVLTRKLIEDNAGAGLITFYYKGSAIAALMAAYPEHKWEPWRFSVVTHGYWKNTDNFGQFMVSLSEKLSIQTLDDWYRVDLIQLQKFGAGNAIKNHGGLYSLLKKVYPNHPWDFRKFQMKKKAQRWLLVNLQKLYPNAEILEDYAHPHAKYTTTKRPIQLDAFIPSMSIAFEYQGKQHFENVGFFQPQAVYQQRDEEKRALCAANNIKLIEVPYWWDRTTEHLKEMIEKSQQAQTSQ